VGAALFYVEKMEKYPVKTSEISSMFNTVLIAIAHHPLDDNTNENKQKKSIKNVNDFKQSVGYFLIDVF